jgi:hypothetical protein
MCLVKEPTKRPTAEKLLRHSFFKHARTSDYIYRHVLEGLPSLGERVKNLKVGIKVSQFVRSIMFPVVNKAFHFLTVVCTCRVFPSELSVITAGLVNTLEFYFVMNM